MLEWKYLLNDERRRKSNRKEGDRRTEFERDYDRIIYMSSFRRLKDKAQVFPLERDDFVRTRLAHSLEVSTLGRSFGVDVTEKIKDEHKLRDVKDSDFPNFQRNVSTILSTACLIHDIGNPPFGHFGEESIRGWFKKYFTKNSTLTDEQKNDFLHFEGNAQALRIVTYLQALDDDKGINLTYGTLGSTIKYLCSSSNIRECPGKSRTKCGYYQSEKAIFEEIQNNTMLNYQRHPLVFLLEAADDLAYSAIDVEDAIQKGAISCEIFCDYMSQKLDKYKILITNFNNNRQMYSKDWKIFRSNYISIQKFRIDATGYMFRDCVDAFSQYYDDIMDGSYDKELILHSNSAEIYEALRSFAKEYVYVRPNVLMLEIVGCKVIQGLLDIFVEAVRDEHRNDMRTEAGKIFGLISPHLRSLINIYGNINDEYQQLQLVTDYISGLTDTYALNLYQNLSGIKLDYNK